MEQLQLAEYQERKQRIKERLNQTVENFIVIGYELRQIRDTESFRMDGYESLVEFAKEEFNLGKDTVSRFISISIRLTVNGEGAELLPELKGMGYSKLQEVLQLPEDDYQLMTPKTTVKEIRELNKFNHSDATAERKAVPEAETILTPLRRCIKDFFSHPGNRGLLNEVMDALAGDCQEGQERILAEDINPSGNRSHQKGLVYLFLYDYNRGVSYKQMGKPQPISMSWHDFFQEIAATFAGFRDEAGETWCNAFGPAPEEEKTQIPGQTNITEFLDKEEPDEEQETTEETAQEKEPKTPKVATSQPKKEKKKEKKKPDPKAGMDEEELSALKAAVAHTVEANPALKALTILGRNLDNALLQIGGTIQFQENGKEYQLKIAENAVQAAGAEEKYLWGFSYFSSEVAMYLLGLGEETEETVKAEEIREVTETDSREAQEPGQTKETAAEEAKPEDDTAAGLEDIEVQQEEGMEESGNVMGLWDEAALAQEKLHLLFSDWDEKTIKPETMMTIRKNAITIAANIERMLTARGIRW